MFARARTCSRRATRLCQFRTPPEPWAFNTRNRSALHAVAASAVDSFAHPNVRLVPPGDERVATIGMCLPRSAAAMSPLRAPENGSTLLRQIVRFCPSTAARRSVASISTPSCKTRRRERHGLPPGVRTRGHAPCTLIFYHAHAPEGLRTHASTPQPGCQAADLSRQASVRTHTGAER